MSIALKPVNIGEVSYNVALLQECLGVLGFPVAQGEIDSTTAGPTRFSKRVRFRNSLACPLTNPPC